MTTSPIAEKDRLVVVRFLDGRILKGTTQDFAPNKTEFHLYEGGGPALSLSAPNP